MPGKPQPLENKQKIANSDGTPTEYFIRWAQTRQIDIQNGITKEQAEQLIIDYIADHPLQAGLGIDILPDGLLSSDPTISLNAVLDDLQDVDTVTTPPTDGQALLWNDTDLLWEPGDVAAGGGGGGGSLTLIETKTVTVATANLDFTGIPAGYQDLFVSIIVRSDAALAVTGLNFQINGDTGANYDNAQTNVNNNAIAGNNFIAQTSGLLAPVPGATAAANKAAYAAVEIVQYANTTFEKGFVSQTYQAPTANTAATQRLQDHSGNWRNTAVINRLNFFLAAGSFAPGTVISIYGRGPAPKAYPGTVIQEIVLLGGETQALFTAIPQTFQDLVVVYQGNATGSNIDFGMRMNGDTGNNYDQEIDSRFEYTVTLNTSTCLLARLSGTTNNTFSDYFEGTIFSYAGTQNAKSVKSTSMGFGGGNYFTRNFNSRWKSVAPITDLRIYPTSGTFTAGKLVLYGRGGPGAQTIYTRPWYWKPPLASSFALMSGDATQITLADDLDVGMTISTPPTTTNVVRMFYRTLTNKALDWDCIFRFNAHLDPLNFSFFGFFARDSIGGRLTTWTLDNGGAAMRVNEFKLNNMNNGFNSSYGVADIRGSFNWLRLRADGTTMRYYTSSDGKMWMEWGAHPVLDFLANRPDQIGIGFLLNRSAGALPLVASIDNFQLTGPAV